MVKARYAVPICTTVSPASLFPLRGFRPEGLHYGLVRLDVGAADEVDAIGHGGEDARYLGQALQRFADRFGLTGQVDDEAALPHDGHLPREDRGRDELQADGAHLLAEPGH